MLAGDESRTVSQFEESSRTISRGDTEPPTQDVAMEDADEAKEKEKIDLEQLFDEEDSDEEFASSGPAVKMEEEASQPAPVYASLRA